MKVYVYHNTDNGDIKVFPSFKKAVEYADKKTPTSKEKSWEDNHDWFFREPFESVYVCNAPWAIKKPT